MPKFAGTEIKCELAKRNKRLKMIEESDGGHKISSTPVYVMQMVYKGIPRRNSEVME
jgi:hypothetical protein